MQVIGIGFGTTNSCVGVWQNDKLKIITNNKGERTMPSYIAFTDDGCLVGEPAKTRASIYPLNPVVDFKQLIGRSFNDNEVQSGKKHWPFNVIEKEGKPRIQVNDKGEIKYFTPEEIISMVLTKLEKIAEAKLGEKIKEAVIAVSGCFNDAQCQAIKDAGAIAGLDVLGIVDKPAAAAAITGDLKKMGSNLNKILVFDLGGGTYDESLLEYAHESN